MPIQVHGVLVHAMSGTELSRVRTEFRLRLPEPINKRPLESRGPTLLCNHVELGQEYLSGYATIGEHLGHLLLNPPLPSVGGWPTLPQHPNDRAKNFRVAHPLAPAAAQLRTDFTCLRLR